MSDKKVESLQEFEARVAYVNNSPIGIIPKNIWLEDRFNALEEAIKRRLGTLYPIPPEWLEERNELLKEIKK